MGSGEWVCKGYVVAGVAVTDRWYEGLEHALHDAGELHERHPPAPLLKLRLQHPEPRGRQQPQHVAHESFQAVVCIDPAEWGRQVVRKQLRGAHTRLSFVPSLRHPWTLSARTDHDLCILLASLGVVTHDLGCLSSMSTPVRKVGREDDGLLAKKRGHRFSGTLCYACRGWPA